jgi:hypothetical protein
MNPRRTSESYFRHMLQNSIADAFSESNPLQDNFKTLQEMWAWFQPLFDTEKSV